MNDSVWTSQAVLDKVCRALDRFTVAHPEGHHFGRPFVTAYQLAIRVDEMYPELKDALGIQVGGAATGGRASLAQYLANQLSKKIKAHGDQFPVEGAYVSNDYVVAMTFRGADGRERSSSLVGSGYDLSLFRLRHP
ncbi:hypothetical protein [Amycolatopsis rifamycinica]|uniref:Uncharacterized protein n=1 Tax=Amycolatopsis rifamycinica TaxID=287986 RepID=A0A066U5J6_9PSEU|nr:hypothetical protein [Amycolatopsis rifamycinica]KDN22691.1 hypothetical protein DV20_08220 [Amycolatopsis rifamycinica]